MNNYFLAKFEGSFTDIFRNICTQFC